MRIPDVLGSSMLKPEPKGRDHGKLGRHDGSLERMCVCGHAAAQHAAKLHRYWLHVYHLLLTAAHDAVNLHMVPARWCVNFTLPQRSQPLTAVLYWHNIKVARACVFRNSVLSM